MLSAPNVKEKKEEEKRKNEANRRKVSFVIIFCPFMDYACGSVFFLLTSSEKKTIVSYWREY